MKLFYLKTFASWIFCFLIAAIAEFIGIPSGWMIGGMLGAIIINLSFPTYSFQPVPRSINLPMNFSQVMIALLAALPSAKSNVHDLLNALPLAILLTIITAFAAYVIAKILVSKLKISFPTAYISLLPGGASGMAVLAEENKADTSFVVFTQYLRVLIISLFIPFVAYFFGQSNHAIQQSFSIGNMSAWAIIITAILIGYVFKFCFRKLPSPFLIPIVIIAAFLAFLFPHQVPEIPSLAIIFAYVYIGMTAGCKITRKSLMLFAHYLHWIMISIISMITICGIFAFCLFYFNIANALDAFLATAPGAIYIVFGFAADGAENGGFIVVMQIIRVIAVLVIAGLLPVILSKGNHEKNH